MLVVVAAFRLSLAACGSTLDSVPSMPESPARSAVRSTRVLIGDDLVPATILVEGERIAVILPHDEDGDAQVIDHRDRVITPALVDTHVHVNEPGRTRWEGFETAARAAAAGGVAVIVDMPLNSIPPTTTVQGLEAKRAAARPHALVDIGFWGGIVPGNLHEVEGLAAAGVFGFKVFLVDSGVDEFGCIGIDDLDATLAAAGALGLPLLVHAEAPGPIAAAPLPGPDCRSYLASRPPEAEVEAIEAVIASVRRTGARAHILHLSAADGLPGLAKARSEGLPISVETCPHYLTFAAEEIPPEACEFKCAPPIRDSENRERLWAGLADGTIDMVVSDHSPCTPELKEGGFDKAWGGIASLELRLPAVWTEARRRGFGIAELARWLSTAPAAFAGINAGAIEPGRRADLVAWDPGAEWTVLPDRLLQRHPVTPYSGRRLRGSVRTTMVRGRMVFDGGRIVEGAGGLLERT